MIKATATTNISTDNVAGIDLKLEMEGHVSEIANEMAAMVGETTYRMARKKEDPKEMILATKNIIKTVFRAATMGLTFRVCEELKARGFSEEEATAFVSAIRDELREAKKK